MPSSDKNRQITIPPMTGFDWSWVISIFIPIFHMPNHVYNELHITGDSTLIEEVERFVSTPESVPKKQRQVFDFNQIIPMPSCVFERSVSLKEEEEHPHRNWYEWNKRHWDTKWNAYECSKNGAGRFLFTTAWSIPHRVIEALSWLFPELTFSLYSQEEFHHFDVEMHFKAGEQIDEPVPEEQESVSSRELVGVS